MTGPTQIVTLNVTPYTAMIRIDSMPLGSFARSNEVSHDTMIAAFELARDRRHVIDIFSPGHKTVRVITGTKDNPWVWGDLNPLLWPYSVADPLSAARYQIVPANFSVNLPDGEGSAPETAYPSRGGSLGWVIWGLETALFVIGFAQMAANPIHIGVKY
jgi:hypothetical protein